MVESFPGPILTNDTLNTLYLIPNQYVSVSRQTSDFSRNSIYTIDFLQRVYFELSFSAGNMQQHPYRSSSAVVPYSTDHERSRQRRSTTRPVQSMEHFEDPMGPSLFGPSTLIPHTSNIFNAMNAQHQQLMQSAFSNRMMTGFEGGLGSMMDQMMSSAMLPSFDRNTPNGTYSSQGEGSSL